MLIENNKARLVRILTDGDQQEKLVYRIGDLAREFGVTLRTLRFYEDRGLIKPQRQGSSRLYSACDRARLKVILLAKQVGFPLLEIHSIMEYYDQGDGGNSAQDALVEKFKGQLEVLEKQKLEVAAAIERLSKAIASLSALQDD